MPESKSKKCHASTIGKGVPSVWLPNPGSSVVYVTSSPPTPTPSSALAPARKCKRGVQSLPHSPNLTPGAANVPARSSIINGVDDDKVVNFFTTAFKLIAHNVKHLPDSEHKRNISNVLRGFTEILPDCEKPGLLHDDKDADVD